MVDSDHLHLYDLFVSEMPVFLELGGTGAQRLPPASSATELLNMSLVSLGSMYAQLGTNVSLGIVPVYVLQLQIIDNNDLVSEYGLHS